MGNASSENLSDLCEQCDLSLKCLPLKLGYFNTCFPVGGKGIGDGFILEVGVARGIRAVESGLEASIWPNLSPCFLFPQDVRKQLWDVRCSHESRATYSHDGLPPCTVTLRPGARIKSSDFKWALSRCLATSVTKITL